MKIWPPPKMGIWSAGVVLALMLIAGLKLFGLHDHPHTPPPTRFSGEAQLMSLTGFSARSLVVRKKINTESLTLPALPANAFSFVVTKKIVPLSLIHI